MPSSAAIAPSPTGTASCIAWPRNLSRRAPSPMVRVPAAASAEYSPSECPATKAACRVRAKPPSASSTRMTARLAASNAGWAFLVRVSSLSGPSNMSRERFCDKASSTSSKTWRAGANVAARTRPMPIACEPCPGNTNARFMRNRVPPFAGLPALVAAGHVVIAAPRPLSRRRSVLGLRQCRPPL